MFILQLTLYHMDNQCLLTSNILQAGQSIFTLHVSLYKVDNQCLSCKCIMQTRQQARICAIFSDGTKLDTAVPNNTELITNTAKLITNAANS